MRRQVQVQVSNDKQLRDIFVMRKELEFVSEVVSIPCNFRVFQDIRARGLKAQVSSLDDFDFEELPNQKIAAWDVVFPPNEVSDFFKVITKYNCRLMMT